jgi:hypothetical protein
MRDDELRDEDLEAWTFLSSFIHAGLLTEYWARKHPDQKIPREEELRDRLLHEMVYGPVGRALGGWITHHAGDAVRAWVDGDLFDWIARNKAEAFAVMAEAHVPLETGDGAS